MPRVSYRFMRRKLVEAGLYPETGLGRFTFFLAMLELALYLGKQISRLAGNTGENFNGWMVLVWLPLSICGFIVFVRWLKKHLLWRLRNRLIVTYVFIGVVPVLLIMLMAGTAAYLFSGQFAMFLVNSDFDAEAKALAASNSAVAAELGARLRQVSLDSAARELDGLTRMGARYADAEVDAWYRGRTLLLSQQKSAEHALQEPKWLKDGFQGIVADDGRFYLRAATLLSVNSHNLVVVSSIPLEPAFERLAGNVGEIRLVGEGNVEIGPDGARLRGGQNLRTRSEANRRLPTITGGALPQAKNFYDKGVQFFGPVTVVDWSNGTNITPLLTVNTRISTLYQRLFMQLGQWANFFTTLLFGTAIVFAAIELVALIFGVGLTRTITRSVAKLYTATQHIERGNFGYRIAVTSKDQLAALESSFNAMAESIQRLIVEQKEKERLESELTIAHEVQEQLFPRENLGVETLELHGVCHAARSVSGDYYDFLHLGQGSVALAVGDISGKGISAALLMATLHSAVRVYLYGQMPQQQEYAAAGAPASLMARGGHSVSVIPANGVDSPSDILWLLNRHLYTSTTPEKYATFFLGLYDGDTRTLTYSNAGHLPPLLLDENGNVRKLDCGGTVVGLFDGMTYEAQRVQMRPGELFIAYSDGITEPENEFGEFGEARLLEVVREYQHLPLARISEQVVAAVQDWIGSQEQPDDITLVLARAR